MTDFKQPERYDSCKGAKGAKGKQNSKQIQTIKKQKECRAMSVNGRWISSSTPDPRSFRIS